MVFIMRRRAANVVPHRRRCGHSHRRRPPARPEDDCAEKPWRTGSPAFAGDDGAARANRRTIHIAAVPHMQEPMSRTLSTVQMAVIMRANVVRVYGSKAGTMAARGV
jgi:hypothetical protein